MDLKKLTGKLMTVVAAGAMVMSIGGGVVWANNCKDEYAHMSFGSDGNDSHNYYEDFDLIDYDVFPGDEIWMYNYVKENGYDGAAIKCESNTGAEYSVGFLWSPDSV